MGHTHTSDEKLSVRKTPYIWRVFPGWYKVYVEDKALKDQLIRLPDCKVHCVYFNRRFQVTGWDVLFPERLYNWVAEVCQLPPRHSRAR